MKLISTTLTGSSENVIGDALASVVDWVDVCLVINTGVSDRSLELARSITREKYVERKFQWIEDFGAARNFALDAAHELGGTWAISVDTDERIYRRGEDVRAILAEAAVDLFLVVHESETYARERVFRLPVRSRFRGPTHEAFGVRGPYGVLEKTRCFELEKTPLQYQMKFERDARVLSTYTRENPSDPRWFYYLGDALQNLLRYEEAIAAYEECASLRGWNEEAAWACYRGAECWCAIGRYDRAIEACAAGLARHAGIAELAWLAGYAAWKSGWADQAIFWSRMSIALGRFEGCGAEVRRIGFRNPNALYEGPYDVLRFALAATGDASGAAEAERKMSAAIDARKRCSW